MRASLRWIVRGDCSLLRMNEVDLKRSKTLEGRMGNLICAMCMKVDQPIRSGPRIRI